MTAAQSIKLNGVELEPDKIAAEAQHHPARTPKSAYQEAARALVIRALLLSEADRQRIVANPEFSGTGKRETEDEARIRQLIEASIEIEEPTEAECKAYYETHPSNFRSPDIFEASHILFAADPKNHAQIAKQKSRAEQVLSDLSKAPQRFGDIARDLSDCASKKNGGRLGQIVRGNVEPEFEQALYGLEAGEIAPCAIQSRYGIHILRLDARDHGEILPFDYVREKISLFLAERNWRRQVAQFINGLLSGAKIEGVDMIPARNAA